jgi:hypothetical protein
MYIRRLMLAMLAAMAANAVSADISGSVYRDYNANGIDDGSLEPGIAGVVVNAYDANGMAVGNSPQLSDASGNYNLTGITGSVRLEFTLPADNSLDFLAPGASGNTTVIFANDGDNTAVGFNNPAQFCQSNPRVSTSCYVNGDPASLSAPHDTVVSFFNNATNKGTIGVKQDTGAVWGLAYDSELDNLYISSVVKRHVGLGVAGPGAIYLLTNATANAPPAATELYDFVDFGISVGTVPSNAARGLTGASPTTANHDAPTFDLVGKAGLGDIELSDDNLDLFVVNLADRLVYQINPLDPLAAPNALPAYPNHNSASCTNGVARPWALNVHDGDLYLGVVCSAENAGGNASHLTASVYRYDGSAWTTAIDQFALNYPREDPYPGQPGAWNPWGDAITDFITPSSSGENFFSRPSPMLTDIQFDSSGNLILGITDRTSMQTGARNYGTNTSNTSATFYAVTGGDILRSTPNGDGTFSVENIVNPNDEFYGGDEFPAPGEEHRETHLGGLAHLFGSNEMLMTAIDPERLDSGGIYWLSNSNGSKVRDLELYRGAAGNGFFGKSAGLGDSELMCDVAPLELGNRLWCDNDSNGVQDPDELNSGFPLVSVVLDCGATPVSVNTNAFGEYLFTDAIYAAANGGALIPRNSNACSISVNTAGANGTALDNFCGGRSATIANSGGADRGADLRDNDAVQLAPDVISIAISDTGASGMNNHALDIGIAGSQDLDFGDAPDPTYPTLVANNGASHVLGSAVYLGSCVDTETDGAPSMGAIGDDFAAGFPVFGACDTGDEDGVVFTETLRPNNGAIVDVTANSACLLDAWIDFNQDGDWSDPGEQVFTSVALGAGTSSLLVSVPAAAVIGDTYARFRCSSAGGLSFTGPAADGEVEDYQVTIQSNLALGDFVWFDTNQNGIQELGEPGVNGVSVDLYNNASCSGLPTVSTTTANGGPGNVDGFYEFQGLLPQDYCVAFSNLPPGYQVSPQNQGADDTVDSDANPATLQIQNINLVADDFTNDMGIFLNGSIAGLTWCESNTNANTSYDAGDGDSLLSGIAVTLYRDANCSNTIDGGDAATAISVDTSGSGSYVFATLPVGSVGNPACYITEVDSNDPDLGVCDTSITTTTLGPDLDTTNPNSTDNNFGFDDQLSLGDFVWFDTNQNGIQDAGELGVNGVNVALHDNASCSGSAVGNTTTANGGPGSVDGYYDFQNLDAGIYCVAFSNLPAGYQVSPQNQGADDAADSDADPATLQIQNINLLDDDFTNDMGVFLSGSVAGLTWCESSTNANTSYDAGDGDMLLSDIQVTLYEDANCSNTVDGGDAATATNMDTDASGAYLFANLAVGPVGNPVCYITEVDNNDADLGNCDAAITPTSLGPDLDTTNPDSTDNNFGFDDQLALGDYVWYDNNQNGRQDVAEPGVNNITVNLYDNATCAGSSVGSTVTSTGGPSNIDGFYFFPDLDAGTYCVEFTNLPSDFIFTEQNSVPDDAEDSDADVVTGQVQNIVLDDTDLTIDAGVYANNGVINGVMFCDISPTNGNPDMGEGISGIQVSLSRDVDCDGSGDVPVGSLDTNLDGVFEFTGLPVAFAPAPPNPEVCYVLNYDTSDNDLLGCVLPITPDTDMVRLDTGNPVDSTVIFGVVMPLGVPVDARWALIALALAMMALAYRQRHALR